MKKIFAVFFFGAVFLVLPTVARAQYSTYSPPWNPPGPDVTQAIIEKNMMRDRLRRNAKKGAKKTAVKSRIKAKRKPVRKKARRISALENTANPAYRINPDFPDKSFVI